MTPADLKAEDFSGYPVQAKQKVLAELPLLRKLPLSYVALLLKEVIAYDWKFPAERLEIDDQFVFLDGLNEIRLRTAMADFSAISLSKDLERESWVTSPGVFSEKLSAYLWATHQIDSFHKAATAFERSVHARSPASAPAVPRLAIAIVGKDVESNAYPLFRKLRPYGTRFTNVKPENGCRTLLEITAARAAAHPGPYAHWYLDGGAPLEHDETLTSVSYGGLLPVRAALLQKLRSAMESGVGSEALRTMLAEMRPEELGLEGSGASGLLNRFKLSILAEGSGTQIYSTTFVQWTAREVLRRAQPLTLLARFAPRQKERSLREMLGDPASKELDPAGSLIDADMGAFYTWINQQRLSGAQQAGFVAWFENHSEAIAIGPGVKRGVESNEAVELASLIQRLQQA